MKLDVVLGLQWGDEGKGKIVDVLASRYQTVARFQGGPNAGHSLHFDGKSFVLRSVPSGIFREDAKNIVGTVSYSTLSHSEVNARTSQKRQEFL